jgi:peptide deformylase
MILPIVQYGDPVLRQKCGPVAVVDDEIRALAADMLETMFDANGVGLAAPQVGRPIRLAVIDVAHDPGCVSLLRVGGRDATLAELMPLVFINPELDPGGGRESLEEGCLSIRDLRAPVRRPVAVRARLPQLDGSVLDLETDGLLARALQHETDHLNGILFVDRVSAATKVGLRGKLRRLAAEFGPERVVE